MDVDRVHITSMFQRYLKHVLLCFIGVLFQRQGCFSFLNIYVHIDFFIVFFL